MKKWYRKLILSIAIIPAIAIIALTICRTVELPPQPTQEEYNILKDYALQVASGNTTMEQNDIEVTRILTSKSFLEIKVQSGKASIIAKYPIEEGVLIKDGKVYHNINYDDVTYIKESLVETKFKCILSGLGGAILWVCILLIVFLGIPIEYRKNLEKEKKLKNPDKRDCYI